MNDHPIRGKETPASSIDESSFDTEVEQCFWKIDKLVMRLDRYPLDAIAVAMGSYLQGLLGALLDERACTVEEVRVFLRDFESGILETIESG